MEWQFGVSAVLRRRGTEPERHPLEIEAIRRQPGQFAGPEAGVRGQQIKHGPLATVEPAATLPALASGLDESYEFAVRQGTSHKPPVPGSILRLQVNQRVTGDPLGHHPSRESLDGPNVVVGTLDGHPHLATLLKVQADLLAIEVADVLKLAAGKDRIDEADGLTNVSIRIVLGFQVPTVVLDVVDQGRSQVIPKRVVQAGLTPFHLPDEVVEHLTGGSFIGA